MTSPTLALAVAVALALAGCGGDDPPAGKPLDCEVVPRAVDRIMGDKAGDPTVIALAPKIKSAMFARCTNDSWKQEALRCIDAAKTRTVMENCSGKLTKDQQRRVQADVKQVQAAVTPDPTSVDADATGGAGGTGGGGVGGSGAPAEAGRGD